ncbi:MAG: hypothetical protein P4L10_03540 [Acidobacteriaceae bacterium]|nr:hypothetical protein [Acidobacteriaceae bacterium]
MYQLIEKFFRSKIVIGALMLCGVSLMSGCTAGRIAAVDTPSFAGTPIHGMAHGGQQPVAGSNIQVWSVGSAGFGSAATPLISSPVTTSDGTGVAITGWSLDVTGTVATFTAVNSYTATSSVLLVGFSDANSTFLNGQTVAVLTSTGTQFTADVTGGVSNATTTATGYANLSSDTNGNAGNAYNTLSLGFFNITGDYTCSGTDVYITATGGDPGIGTNNSALALAAPLGTCTNLAADSFITINELTTVAMTAAVGQYFTSTFGSSSTDSFGAPNNVQALLGIANAFQTALTLVNVNSGTLVSSATGTPSTITITPNASKLTTMANILASCVNSDGLSDSTCPTLFADVVTTSGTVPTDTLQAAVYMSLNPTSNNANGSTANLTQLYGLATPGSPFIFVGSSPFIGSGVGTQPTDWTISIMYSDTTGASFPYPQRLAIDSSGNIWIINNSSTSTDGQLTELNGSAPGTVTFTSTIFGSSSTSIAAGNPRDLAIDTNNNVWFTAPSASQVFEYTPGTAANTALNYGLGFGPYGISINGNNDVFVGESGSAAPYGFYEFPSANISHPVRYPVVGVGTNGTGTSGTNSYVQAQYLAFDTNGNLWMTNGGATPTDKNDVIELAGVPNDTSLSTVCTSYPCTLTSSNFTTGSGYVISTGYSTPWGIAAGVAGAIWIANRGGSGVYELASGNSTQYAASVSGSHGVAIDGSGNVWFTTGNAKIYEMSSAGTLNSSSGFYISGSTASSNGIAIDPSGNVWVASSIAEASGTPSVISELVGAATPTVTPIALSLKNGTVGANGIAISLTGASSASLGASNQFTASVDAPVATAVSAPNLGVTWLVNGVTGGTSTYGTISTTGVYTAPLTMPSPSMATITASLAGYP